jgi:ammonia channel protein AmtB
MPHVEPFQAAGNAGAKAPPSLEVGMHVNAGDTAWMLTSTALVFFMMPGLALFYGGLVGAKNVIATMVQSFVAIAVISLLWVILGYSLAFGANHGGGDRQPAVGRAARGQRHAEQLRSHDSVAGVHGVPDDVRRHHSGAHRRGV